MGFSKLTIGTFRIILNHNYFLRRGCNLECQPSSLTKTYRQPVNGDAQDDVQKRSPENGRTDIWVSLCSNKKIVSKALDPTSRNILSDLSSTSSVSHPTKPQTPRYKMHE